MLTFVQNSLFSQARINNENHPFVSIKSGAYFPTKENFKEIFSTHFALINGVSMGIPIINKNFFFYSKAMYFRKKGVPIIYHYESKNGIDTFYTTQEGGVELEQWNINLGLQYTRQTSNSGKIFFNGGVLIVKSSSKYKLTPEINTTARGLAGFFIGTGYEKKLQAWPLSLFTELQYNFDRGIIWFGNPDFGGGNVNVGIRYYFKE